jgi:hypothetical protein
MESGQEKLGNIVHRLKTDREFAGKMGARLLPYFARLAENNQRVNRLLQFFDEDLKEREGGEDILRAAVVLIHASLEDFLRTLASELLPAGDENSLKDIPLAGSGSFGRNEKFVLGQLAQHRGKTVDELLRQSVADNLGRSNYNNTKEIAQLLTKIGFKPEEHNDEFAAIDQMIQRRHQIVHRADRVDARPVPVLQHIERPQVADWLTATYNFTARLIVPLMKRLPDLLESSSRRLD